MDYAPIVLKNKGVPVEFAVVERQADGAYKRKFNEEGDFEREKVYIRFTHNTISDIEDRYSTLELWQVAMDTRLTHTLRTTLAIATGREERMVGEAMIEGMLMIYSNAINTSWGIANGMDPTAAGRLLRKGNELAEKEMEEQNKRLTAEAEKENSPGKSGSRSGVKRAAASESSGN